VIDCYHCGDRIPESADDIALSNRGTGELRIYHSAGPCKYQADEDFFSNAPHGDWYIALRHVWFDPIESEGVRR